MGNPAAISLGPGILYVAQLGTAEPTDLDAPWASGWKEIGYTEEGSEFSSNTTSEDVEVAEEIDPIAIIATKRETSLSLAMVEITARNLKIAFNGGAVTTNSGVVKFEPPELGDEHRLMFGFESQDHEERWIFRKCFQAGDVKANRNKGAKKTQLPVTLRCEKPDPSTPSFAVLFHESRHGGNL